MDTVAHQVDVYRARKYVLDQLPQWLATDAQIHDKIGATEEIVVVARHIAVAGIAIKSAGLYLQAGDTDNAAKMVRLSVHEFDQVSTDSPNYCAVYQFLGDMVMMLDACGKDPRFVLDQIVSRFPGLTIVDRTGDSSATECIDECCPSSDSDDSDGDSNDDSD